MSSTSNAQDLLVNVFRPTYRWDSNTGFVPSLTISNVSEIITGSLKTDLLVVSDTGNNTYIGSNAGLYASNTAYNVGLGYQAMGGAINSSNNVAVGYYALDGAKNSTSNVVLGSYSGLTNSNGGVRNVLIGPNVTVGTGSGNILIGSDISLASGTNRFQLGKLLYGDLSSGYIGVNTNDPKSAFDVSGTTLIRGKLGIQTVPNPKYSLDVNGSIFANDRFFGGKGTVAEPVYSFDDVSESGMYVPQASEGYGNGAFAIAVNQKPAAIFSSNAVNFFQNLDVSGTFSACNVELAAFSVEAGSRAAPTITFASNRADGFYHLADTSGFAVVTMGQDRMMFLESGDISSSRILGSDISLAGAIFTTAGCNVVGGVTLSNGNVILTGTATNSNLLVPGWIRNNETAPIVDISGGVVRAVRFRAQDGTATAPAYSFLNDASSGMRLVTRNTIAFDTSGTQRMCISAGFVGIGTANPRVALEVVGDVSATTYNGPGGTAGAPHYTFSDDRTTGVFFPGANMIGMTAGGTERMRISNGFIGIGTTPSASSALDVSGVFRIIGANGNITFNNGTIDVSGTPLVSTTGAFSNAATTTSNYIGGVTLSNFDVSLMSNGQFRTMTGTSNYIGGVTLSNFDVSLMSSGRFRTMTGTSNYIGGVTLSNFDVSLIGQGRILGPSASSNSIGGFGLSNGRIQTNTTDTFVVVTGLTPSIVTSTDGVTWTTRDANTVFTTSGRGVAWNGTLWVATGVGTNTIATSSDGLTWTGRDSASNIFSGGGRGIAWNGSLWLAVGSGTNNTIATSPDGINWTGRGTAITNAGVGRAAAWNGSLWVVVSAGGNTIVTSPDGINWTTRDAASLITSAYCVAWNGRLWVVGGTGGSALLTSSDGITWTTRSSDFTTVVGVAWNGSFWVAVGSGTNTIATSPDGVTWTSRVTSSSIFSAGGNGGVSWNGRVWTAVAADVAKIVTSPDGVTWTQQYTATVYGTASRRYVLPTITSAEFDANGGSLTYSGSLLGSNVASSNSIGGVTLSNFDLCMASTGRILGMPTISNYIGGVTLSNFDLCMASTGRILGMPTISNYIGGVTLSNFDVSLIGQGRILGFPTSSNRIGGVTLSNSNVFTGNGSATIPTYAFTNDPSTGLHLATGSRLAFDTSGVQRMVIVDSSIGIGTSNPRWTVDISGSGAQRIQVSGQDAAINLQDQRVADPFILFQNASNYGVYSSNALPFWLWQSNVVRMCISGVFTGIGTTAPTSTLDIKGATTPLLRLSDGTNRNPIIELNRNDGASFGSTVFVDWRMQATANGANLQFVRGSTTGTLTALHVDGTNGLVGIKTIGPATTLDVSHDGTGPGGAVGFFLRGASGAGIGLNISNGTKSLDLGIATSSGAWAGNSITGDAVLRTTAPGRLLFNANGSGGTAALTISGDKVGIGCFNGDSSSGLIHLDISGATRFGRSINGTNNLILIADTASGLPVTRHGIGILNVPTGSGNGGGDLAFNTYNDAGAPLNTAPPAMVIKRSNGNVGILCNAPQYQLDVSGTIGAHSNEYTMYIPGTASGTTTYTIPTGFSHVHVTAVGAGGGGGGGNGGSGGGGGGGGGAGQTVQQLVPSVTGTTFQVGFGSGGAGGSASSSGGAGTDTTVTIGVYTIKADGGQGGGGASTGSLGGVGGGGFGTTYGGGGGGGGGGSSPNTAGGGGVGTLVSGASGLAGSVGAGGAGGSGGGTINSAARMGLAGGGGGGGGPLGGAGGVGGANGSLGGQGCGGGGGGGASGGGGGGGRGYAILKFLR